MASATATAINVVPVDGTPLEGTTLIRASLNASIAAVAELRVKALTPFAVDDEFTVKESCLFVFGICVSILPIELNRDVFLNDLLGEPEAVVERFRVFDSDIGDFKWFVAGETASLGGLEGAVKLESDGKLTYTRPTYPVTLFEHKIQFDYELKNTLGTSTATVRIRILSP